LNREYIDFSDAPEMWQVFYRVGRLQRQQKHLKCLFFHHSQVLYACMKLMELILSIYLLFLEKLTIIELHMMNHLAFPPDEYQVDLLDMIDIITSY